MIDSAIDELKSWVSFRKEGTRNRDPRLEQLLRERIAGTATLQKEVTYVRETPKIGRNAPCPCGSGRKFKKCCGTAG